MSYRRCTYILSFVFGCILVAIGITDFWTVLGLGIYYALSLDFAYDRGREDEEEENEDEP